jgi:Fe-S cluster assembly scaffold protein SufB
MKTLIDDSALSDLPSAGRFIEDERKRAWSEFGALPIPSAGTEEWRYTDLSSFDFDYQPFAAGAVATNLDEVPDRILAAAGVVGERAGLQIQHNGSVAVSNLDADMAAKGVIFGDLDLAAQEHPAGPSCTCLRALLSSFPCRPSPGSTPTARRCFLTPS